MRDPAAIGDSENWAGGFYELAMELGPRNDVRLQAALEALERVNGADGYVAGLERGSDRQRLTLEAVTRAGHLRGVVQLPNGHPAVCGVWICREDNGPDWLDFYVPLGALARTDRRVGGFPFGPDDGSPSLMWRRPIDEWLAGIGTAVFQEVPFQLGLIGHEALGEMYALDVIDGPPADRSSGFLVPRGDELAYTPANR